MLLAEASQVGSSYHTCQFVRSTFVVYPARARSAYCAVSQLFHASIGCLLTSYRLGLASILILLPRIPSNLGPYIPQLFTAYAKVLTMSQALARTASSMTITESHPASSHAFSEHFDVPQPKLKAEIKWSYTNPTKAQEMESNLPVREVFTYLYGLLPCNFLAFLKTPIDYLGKHDYPLPFARQWDEPTLGLKDVGLYSEVNRLRKVLAG